MSLNFFENQSKFLKKTSTYQPKDKLKFNKIFNSISNIYDPNQLNPAFEKLKTVQDRIYLVDRLVNRRKEIKKAKDQERINKLTPLINKMKQNYLTKTAILRKKSENLEKSESSNNLLKSPSNNHYRRLSLVGGVLISNSNQTTRKSISILPKINEKPETNQLIKKNESSLNELPPLEETIEKKISFKSFKNFENVEDKKQKDHKKILTIITKLNEAEEQKIIKLSNKRKSTVNPSILKRKKSYMNNKLYNSDFHLIPIETPQYSPLSKKYQIMSSTFQRSDTYKPPVDNRKIIEVLEKDLLKFCIHQNNDFLNTNPKSLHKDLATVEIKVKSKLKEILNQEKINNLQKKYYFRDTFDRKLRNFCKKCVKKKKIIPEKLLKNHQKSTSSTIRKTTFFKKRNHSLENQKIYPLKNQLDFNNENGADNDDSFVSYTEMKLSQIYKETGEIIKYVNMLDQSSSLNIGKLSKIVKKDRKEKIKTLDDRSWELYNVLKKKTGDNSKNFIVSIN